MTSCEQKTGMKVAKFTLDGNCMFNSVRICLFGNKSASNLLRLHATCHVVQHFKEYVKIVMS